MFGRKEKTPKSTKSSTTKPKTNELKNLLGVGVLMDDNSDDEESYLAELAALEGSKSVKEQPNKKNRDRKRRKRRTALPDPSAEGVLNMNEIDKMASFGLEDNEDDGDNESYDESELMDELNDLLSGSEGSLESNEDKKLAITQTEMLNELHNRKELYTSAILNAKTDGASSKVSRFQRGLKEIDRLINRVQKGDTIDFDSIPPPVVVKGTKSDQSPAVKTSSEKQPTEPVLNNEASSSILVNKPDVVANDQPIAGQLEVSLDPDTSDLTVVLTRQKEFKIAALKHKQNGDMEKARAFLATSKQFNPIIEAVKSGEKVDLSQLPTITDDTVPINKAEVVAKMSVSKEPIIAEVTNKASIPESISTSNHMEPSSLLEGLLQREEKYTQACNKAKEEGNGSKARRMGRIVQQYKDAIKACKNNKSFDYAELPTPPGFGPLPGISTNVSKEEDNIQVPVLSSVTSGSSTAEVAQKQPIKSGPTSTRNEKEYNFLVNRQKEFKAEALKAKKNDDIELARKYLRQAKGFDEMILAAQNGLRVDVSTVPSLQEQSNSSLHATTKQVVEFQGSQSDQYKQIETALRKQIQASEKNVQHYRLLGNLDAANNFETLLKSSKNDLQTLLSYMKQGNIVPRCNYITKSFPVIRSNPELSDSEMKLTIVRCANIPLPSGLQVKDMHLYTTYEFLLPGEKVQCGYTSTKKESVNPEYNEVFKLSIDRKSRSFARVCKRQSVTIKVYYVRGFLKSDKAIGQANIKLNLFSNKCDIHQSLDLMDLEKGRKSVGGKVEVMLQIREPVVDKDAEIVKEKWLVLDTHLRSLELKTPAGLPQVNLTKETYQSLEVLNQEKVMLQNQLSLCNSSGKPVPATLTERLKTNQENMASVSTTLKKGGNRAINEYMQNLLRGLEIEKVKAQGALKDDNKDLARSCLVRRKLVQKEIAALKEQYGNSS